MTVSTKERWRGALRQLRAALMGDRDATDVLDKSRQRIRDARDALERAGLQPRGRPFVHFAPQPITGSDERAYFVLVDERHGGIIWHRLRARDDDEAMDRAKAQAGDRAFDVWDGCRFIDRVEATIP